MEFKPNKRTFYRDFYDSAKKYLMGFVTVKLEDSKSEVLNKYDTSKEWVYPVQIFSKKQLALDGLIETIELMTSQDIDDYIISDFEEREKARIKEKVDGYSVQRHKKYGEVPFFDWYEKNFEHEYS
ncbi:MAG TPA: hypothetical protein ENJ28_03450 [Gammaproteobacteria bacterium]|nr:hypothetical protein [Gammaproteobacteria bacterium]